MRSPPRPTPRGPDREAALAQYRQRAGVYDLELALFEPLRAQAIECLALQPGQHVLDVGCGTGLSLARLRQGVGPQGRVTGIEQSPEMLAQARSRVQRGSSGALAPVKLVCAAAEDARIAGRADAALFHFTHDILCSAAALDHVFAHLRPGARVVATGLRWAPPWALPMNLFVWGAALRSVSTLQGLAAPWSLLAERADAMQREDLLFGAAYRVVATLPLH